MIFYDVNDSGKNITDFKYDYASYFREGMAPVKMGFHQYQRASCHSTRLCPHSLVDYLQKTMIYLLSLNVKARTGRSGTGTAPNQEPQPLYR